MIQGEVNARLAARVQRLSPARRIATVTLKSVGPGRSYSGAYVAATEELAPVTPMIGPRRHIGRLVKVDPTETGAELDLIIGDNDAWQALAAGTAKVEAVVAFKSNLRGDPVDGRPVRVEIG